MERAGRQFSRTRDQGIRHIRRAVLLGWGHPARVVVVVTQLPAHRQRVRDLATADEIVLSRYLRHEASAMLKVAFDAAVEAL